MVLRIWSSERLARIAAPACSGEGLTWGASCVPIRNGCVTKRSASACKRDSSCFVIVTHGLVHDILDLPGLMELLGGDCLIGTAYR